MHSLGKLMSNLERYRKKNVGTPIVYHSRFIYLVPVYIILCTYTLLF